MAFLLWHQRWTISWSKICLSGFLRRPKLGAGKGGCMVLYTRNLTWKTKSTTWQSTSATPRTHFMFILHNMSFYAHICYEKKNISSMAVGQNLMRYSLGMTTCCHHQVIYFEGFVDLHQLGTRGFFPQMDCEEGTNVDSLRWWAPAAAPLSMLRTLWTQPEAGGGDLKNRVHSHH